MAKQIDLNSLVHSLVANEVAAALAPYRNLLDRMAVLMGPAAAPATAAAAPRARNVVRPGRTRRTKARGQKNLAVAKPAVAVARDSEPAAPAPARLSAAAAAQQAELVAKVADFNVGQRVMYKQGQGEFEATIVAVVGTELVLDRVRDGKRFKKRVDRVHAA